MVVCRTRQTLDADILLSGPNHHLAWYTGAAILAFVREKLVCRHLIDGLGASCTAGSGRGGEGCKMENTGDSGPILVQLLGFWDSLITYYGLVEPLDEGPL